MKLLVGIFLVSFIVLSCNQKGVSLNEEKLIGLSFEEKVELPEINYSQTSIISFENSNLYSRTGIMYIKQTGRYFVDNDILEIHYACGEHCNRNSTCGVQQYILGTNGNLHLIYLRESYGNIEDLDDTPFDLELERL
jgi:hypothetical protein